MNDTIHDFPVIGSVLTGRVDGNKKARIILVDRGPDYATSYRYVTGFHWTGEAEWSTGHYFNDFKQALEDFWERISFEVGLGK